MLKQPKDWFIDSADQFLLFVHSNTLSKFITNNFQWWQIKTGLAVCPLSRVQRYLTRPRIGRTKIGWLRRLGTAAGGNGSWKSIVRNRCLSFTTAVAWSVVPGVSALIHCTFGSTSQHWPWKPKRLILDDFVVWFLTSPSFGYKRDDLSFHDRHVSLNRSKNI